MQEWLKTLTSDHRLNNTDISLHTSTNLQTFRHQPMVRGLTSQLVITILAFIPWLLQYTRQIYESDNLTAQINLETL